MFYIDLNYEIYNSIIIIFPMIMTKLTIASREDIQYLRNLI